MSVWLEDLRSETLTVGELKRLLEPFQDDLPVVATWEGVYVAINSGYGQENTPYTKLPPMLVLNVDNI